VHWSGTIRQPTGLNTWNIPSPDKRIRPSSNRPMSTRWSGLETYIKVKGQWSASVLSGWSGNTWLLLSKTSQHSSRAVLVEKRFQCFYTSLPRVINDKMPPTLPVDELKARETPFETSQLRRWQKYISTEEQDIQWLLYEKPDLVPS